MDIREVEKYVNIVIPNIEGQLADETKTPEELLEIYNLYVEVLRLIAPFNFQTYNKYLELDENHHDPTKAFYHHRKDHLEELFTAFNDMEIYDAYDMLLISLPPRIGKEQPLTSKILTPTGWKPMGDMKVGTEIIGSDGMSHFVTGVFPQGTKDVYTVTFDDGTTVECGLEHLWEVQTRDDRKDNKSRVVSTEDMIKNLYVENGTRKNYSVKYVSPIDFSHKIDLSEDIHPYVLGALIGDGGFSKSVKFTNIDADVLDRIEELLPETDSLNKIADTIMYGISKKSDVRNDKGHPTKCSTHANIEKYGLLNKRSHEKFIPKKYLYSRLEDRIELLKGLMDTDGYVPDTNSSYCEYSTVSPQLAEDVIELIRSLGGRATFTTKRGLLNGAEHKIVYRIVFNISINPFYCRRKSTRFTPRAKRQVKYISSIEKAGVEECQCIMVDAPDHLYVTDGYNLTHNTTSGIRFLAWIIGKYPEHTQLATSYSDAITTSFYIGVMEIIQSERHKKVFPESPLISQNAKREEIWLKVAKRYPSITFAPINGSMTGRCEASKYLYCDDLVSGIEEAMSVTRLEKLWQLYTVNAKQRKKEGCKEIHVATRWSVHDPITRLSIEQADNPRCKVITIPCYDENGESRFDYTGGFSTEFYRDLQSTMDAITFDALYQCDPIEREGILYNKDELQYYFTLPDEAPDTIIAICDSKNLGKDYVSAQVGYVYGELIYIEDVVFNNGLPEITRPLVAELFMRNKVVRADIELNNGGNFYAEKVQELITQNGGKTSIRIFFSGNNKQTKIITYSDFVKKHFLFKDPSTYAPNSEYAQYMRQLTTWTQRGKNKFDDGVDSTAMLAQLFQDLSGMSIKILDRKALKI